MKETLYTIPLMDAFKADDECPLCFIHRKLEQDSLDYMLGSASSYMQSDVREKTNKLGFCSNHYKKMYDYGNALGNALMLESYIEKLRKDFSKKSSASVGKPTFLSKLKKDDEDSSQTSIGSFCQKVTKKCFLCQKEKETFDRYVDTFFSLFRSNEEFKDMLRNSKGFCLEHYGTLADTAADKLGSRQLDEFLQIIYPQMEQALERLHTDISWFIEKFDYRQKDADWKNSKDAVQRCMQKVTTGYPADEVYKSKR